MHVQCGSTIMNKAFVKETNDDDAVSPIPEMPVGVRNYITPDGYHKLQTELQTCWM